MSRITKAAQKRHEAIAKADRVSVNLRVTADTVKRELVKRDKAVADANGRVCDAIITAQDAGVPMREIAEAMRMSRQAVYQFLDRHAMKGE